MAQKYRIYINQNVLLITDETVNSLVNYQLIDTQNFDFRTFYKNLKKGGKTCFLLATDHPKKAFNRIKDACLYIKAAGGRVKNDEGECLFIFRNGKWDLPKGKVEKNEKMKIAAVREVEEECGIKVEKRGKRICKTYHIYEMNNKMVLKRTNWYAMNVKGSPALVPQQEEGITAAVWVKENKMALQLKNTYPLIIDVLSAD